MCTKTGKPTATVPVFITPVAGSATTVAVCRRRQLAMSMGSGTAHARRRTPHAAHRCAILMQPGGRAATVNPTQALCDDTSRRRRRCHRLELPPRRCKEPTMSSLEDAFEHELMEDVKWVNAHTNYFPTLFV